MSRTVGIALIVWNAILSVLVAWILLRAARPEATVHAVEDQAIQDDGTAGMAVGDSVQRKDARIAFFYMDSLRAHLDLLQERSEHFKSEGRRLENEWQNELARAQGRYEELVKKDRTYSTEAEIKADKRELEQLDARIGELKQNSEDRMAKLEMEILAEVSKEIEDFLKDYNQKAGFDYIISLEPGGQIWPGDPDLDVTQDVLDGLNARHQAKKNVPKDKTE